MGVLGLWSLIEGAGNATNKSGESPSSYSSSDATQIYASPNISLTLESRCASAAATASHSSAVSSSLRTSSSSPSSSYRLLAVDLSVWLMEAHSIARTFEPNRGGAAPLGPLKYHLQYIFQRACAFLRQSIRLVFVSDGRAPKIKARGGVKGVATTTATGASSSSSSHRSANPLYTSQIRDCAHMFELMDLPLIMLTHGEAEAMCGILNARGSVDGVITPDADCFLFGARTVLKNIEASQLNLTARIVDMQPIAARMGLEREQLILLALLLGSDYSTGVRGLGPRKAFKFVQVLNECSKEFENSDDSHDSNQHATIRLFRHLVKCESPDVGVKLIMKYHPGLVPSSAPSSITAASSSSHHLSSSSSSSSSSSLITIDYSLFSLTELKAEMAKHGLKAQTKSNMIAKLQQIQLLSPTSAAISSSSAAASLSSPLISSRSSSSAPCIVLSDSDSDSDGDDGSSDIAPKSKSRTAAVKKKSSKSSKKSRSMTLQSFLITYFTKIHARYHGSSSNVTAAFKEMDHIIESYLHPILQPSVDVCEKKIKDGIPSPSSHFLQLRSFCANELKMSFVKFEKLWIPTLLHLELWQRSENRLLIDDVIVSQHGDDEEDADEIMLTPPERNHSYPTVPLSGSSTASSSVLTRAGSSSSQLAAASSSSASSTSPLYTSSHIAKRRIIQGIPTFVLIWQKTERGQREIATLPKSCLTPSATSREADADDADDVDNEASEFDLTLTPSPIITSASSSPLISSNPAPTSLASASSTKKLPIQDMDINFYETYEPVSFLTQCLPDIVAMFVSEEEEKASKKEREKLEKVNEKAAAKQKRQEKKQADGDDDETPTAKPKATRARSKKLSTVDSTPPITSFLSPIITSSGIAPSSSPRISSDRHDMDDDSLMHQSSSPLSVAVASGSSKSTKQRDAASSIFSKPMLIEDVATSSSDRTASQKPSERQQKYSLMSHFTQSKKVRSHEQAIVQTSKKVTSSILIDDSPPPPSASSTCPLCSCAFPSFKIDAHVNSCLDEQQLRADEQVARKIHQQRSPVIVKVTEKQQRDRNSNISSDNNHNDDVLEDVAAPLEEGDQDDELVILDDNEIQASSSTRTKLAHSVREAISDSSVIVTSATAPTYSSSYISPVSSRISSPRVTPQKRKLSSSDSEKPQQIDLTRNHFSSPSLVDDSAAASSSFASSLPNRRTIISLDDNDEDEDEPGSTIYIKQKQTKLTMRTPVPSIFMQL